MQRFLPLLLLLPFLEIAVFILVGREIGVLATLLLTVLAIAVGAALLRVQRTAVLRRIRAHLEEGQAPARPLFDGALVSIAGLLLIVPGFATDAIGLLLFVPALRDRLWRALTGRLRNAVEARQREARARAMRDGRPVPPPVIELSPDEFSSRSASGPWRRGADAP